MMKGGHGQTYQLHMCDINFARDASTVCVCVLYSAPLPLPLLSSPLPPSPPPPAPLPILTTAETANIPMVKKAIFFPLMRGLSSVKLFCKEGKKYNIGQSEASGENYIFSTNLAPRPLYICTKYIALSFTMECKFFSFYIIQLTYCMCTGAWPAVCGQDRWVWL